MQANIDSIKAMMAEQQVLLNTLSMWNQVRAQGIDPDDVAVFGFDPKLMTPKELFDAQRKSGSRSNNNPFNWPTYDDNGRQTIRGLKHNFVRLHSGETVQLSPMIDRP